MQPRVSLPHRLVQSVMTQWFPSGAMYHEGIDNKIDAAELQWLAPVRIHPDLPRGDTSPLPYAEPKNEEQRRANVRAVADRAASGADAFFEFNHDRNLAEENADRAAEMEYFYSNLVDTVTRELCCGGSLRFRVKPTGFGYWVSATDDNTPLAILEAIVGAEAATPFIPPGHLFMVPDVLAGARAGAQRKAIDELRMRAPPKAPIDSTQTAFGVNQGMDLGKFTVVREIMVQNAERIEGWLALMNTNGSHPKKDFFDVWCKTKPFKLRKNGGILSVDASTEYFVLKTVDTSTVQVDHGGCIHVSKGIGRCIHGVGGEGGCTHEIKERGWKLPQRWIQWKVEASTKVDTSTDELMSGMHPRHRK
ncbi:hypothetical protein C8R45DRAFT_920278 [Mycena sanguinolenta]|nr:hypothetical protein C8R45DRAFT_920278 [Mycena sanguinolenta]